jgi:adenylylsulfate kinase-like enzyme
MACAIGMPLVCASRQLVKNLAFEREEREENNRPIAHHV